VLRCRICHKGVTLTVSLEHVNPCDLSRQFEIGKRWRKRLSANPNDTLGTEAFRFFLRRQTRSEHHALDTSPVFPALLEGTLCIDGYRRLMSAFHDLYRHMEPPLQSACAQHRLDEFGFLYEARTPILAAELEIIGLGDAGSGKGQARARPSFESIESLAGALYVIEGSLLGGSTMCGAVDKLLAKVGLGPNAYWNWCRSEGPGRWAMTCQLLERVADNDDARRSIVGAARMTFRSFSQGLGTANPVRVHDKPC
jgi:heme oxygenase (biliverdin-IX-beta and delta-forming)